MRSKKPTAPVAGITTGQGGKMAPAKDAHKSLRTGGVPLRQPATPLVWLGTLLAVLRGRQQK
ncbi:hypothetical protein ACFQ44_12795 [Levilactobacillus lanxiensis]|uniref:LPXTG cell wall anchor domain-containing protein n=1 Tax=Levilactobacillus lanxiensis TaxID=2799568 RepID=A0ABW4D976_9LACO|nr:hypothetical protein [Levilactobacillus lanxiensis]